MSSKKQRTEQDNGVTLRETVGQIESQNVEEQKLQTQSLFEQLYSNAAQPKSSSGNACVRLCGFVEQCAKSQSVIIRSWAFTYEVIEKLFNFYIEWNEYDHHRSMRLVLDIITHLIKNNPDTRDAESAKLQLMRHVMSVIVGRSTKPVAKSAMKTLEHFITKKVVALSEVRICYRDVLGGEDTNNESQPWSRLIGELLRWMKLHFVSPTAGKLVVCIYRLLRQGGDGAFYTPSVDDWYKWLHGFVNNESQYLERVKNHICLPLFMTDRPEALLFVQRMANMRPIATANGVGEPDLLQLAVLEIGKKVGLVEEPALGEQDVEIIGTTDSFITLNEAILERVLSYPSHEVRSLAFSILIASPSTTKPYSETAFTLLRKHIASLFADSDAKFRVDVSAGARDMFKRVRGAIFVLKRSIPRARAKAEKNAKFTNIAPTDSTTGPVVYRANLVYLPEADLVHCLNYHEAFLKWYLDFLCFELVPTVSYQRHITSLKALANILRLEGNKEKTWETADDQQLFFDLFDDKWSRALFDLVMDPFDDVRSSSASVLKSLFADERYRNICRPDPNTTRDIPAALSQLLQTADQLAQKTARADHADGVARISQLLYRFSDGESSRVEMLSGLVAHLDVKITIAEKDLGQAVREVPVHGDFAALCSIWQAMSELCMSEAELDAVRRLQDNLITSCQRIWVVVRDTLCDDSPEGHLPLHLEEMEGLNTKGLISYSFRAVYESSNLMRTIILTIRNRSRTDTITPSVHVFQNIGDLTFDQLSQLRHRGAFSTVSATFTTCCQQSKYFESESDETLPLVSWYKKTLDTINTQVSTTRRSAGIPSLITGILSANATTPAFEEVMQKLLEIARIEARVTETDGSRLPQVHAYNSIKDIFRNSVLTSQGNKSENYLSECLELAASGLRSEVWAIRNCALILLRSLIDCLFGNHENKSTVEAGWDGKANRIPYHRYVTLPGVLTNLLQSGHKMMTRTTDTTSAESVFPALDIIRRAGPPDMLRDEIQSHIVQYLSSPVWHVREMAARTMCSCLLHDKWLDTIDQVFQDATKDITGHNNHVHGALLMLKFVFERLTEVSVDLVTSHLDDLVTKLGKYEIDARYSRCPDIIAAYLEIVNQIWQFQQTRYTALAPLDVNVSNVPELALLRAEHIVNQVYLTSQSTNPVANLRELLLTHSLGANTLLKALETIPQVWSETRTPDEVLSELCGLYIDISLAAKSPEVQAAAINSQSNIIDKLCTTHKFNLLPVQKLLDQWERLPLQSMNPELSNAIIRASGSVVAAVGLLDETRVISIRSWSMLLADASLADNDFDTRFAASESIRSYFRAVKDNCRSDDHISLFITLYDMLNDDDEDVRDVAADAVTCILGASQEPIEAATCFLAWLATTFKSNKEFKNTVCSRVVGTNATGTGGKQLDWQSAKEQLSPALQFDDSLFIVEEQNLFIDEVRETNRWINVFETLDWEASDNLVPALDTWTCNGMESFNELLQQGDGPLGWASNPDVFAICFRIIEAAVSLTQLGKASQYLKEETSKTKAVLAKQNTSASKLLVNSLTAI